MRPEEIRNQKIQNYFMKGILDAAEKIGRGETGYTDKELEENCKKNISAYKSMLLPLLQDIYIKDYFESLAEVWVRSYDPYVAANAYELNEDTPCASKQCKLNISFLDCLGYDWRKAYRGPENIQRNISSHHRASAKPSVQYCFMIAEKITNNMEVTPSLKEYLPTITALLYLKLSKKELRILSFPFKSPSIGENGVYRGRYLLTADEKKAKQAQELFRICLEKNNADISETKNSIPKEKLIHEYLATLLFLYILFHNPMYTKMDIETIQKNIVVFDQYTFGLVQALTGDYPNGLSPSEEFIENVRHVAETIFENTPYPDRKDSLFSDTDDLKYSFMVFDFFATRRLQYGEMPYWAILYQETRTDTLAYNNLMRLKEHHPYLLREQLCGMRSMSDFFNDNSFFFQIPKK